MALAKITTKGQVTIPKSIRDSLHLNTGDKIEIIIKEGEAIIRPLSKKVDDLFGILKRPNQKVLSVDEMNQAISNKIKSKHK
ncbi:MAG: AbrB/MazE/SpoVT family DNA-binding domain-containing protein [Lentisphaerales bacterium]|nr:AbrB/MazE/SpoVT family DNA-binding domain-containing protein [Lentisphaerales bacterium]